MVVLPTNGTVLVVINLEQNLSPIIELTKYLEAAAGLVEFAAPVLVPSVREAPVAINVSRPVVRGSTQHHGLFCGRGAWRCLDRFAALRRLARLTQQRRLFFTHLSECEGGLRRYRWRRGSRRGRDDRGVGWVVGGLRGWSIGGFQRRPPGRFGAGRR